LEDNAFNDIDGSWQVVGGRRRKPQEKARLTVSSFKELLFRRAKGKCFKCLLPDHRVAQCTNLAKCLLCGESGHKARWCKVEKEGARASGVGVSVRVSKEAASAPAARPVKVGGMSAPASFADERPAMVCAAAPRSAAIAEAERRLARLGVVAVEVGRCPDLELADVGRLIARHFRISESSVSVTMRAAGEYLLVFSGVSACNMAVQWQGAVNVGPASFMLSPWMRFRGARAGKLCFKARVCIEGVPADAHQVEAIRGLFGATDIIEGIDSSVNSKEESACCTVWVWMENVAKLARRGRLDLEEPLELESPLLHFPELGIEAEQPVRMGPVRTLSYDVLLHLDRVLDYSVSPPSSPESHVSYHSDVSGIPSDVSMTPACPTTWAYRWFLGFEAGPFPPPPPRASAHSRLRFPDGRDGDGGGGAGANDQSGRRGQGSGDGRRSRGEQQDGGGRSTAPSGRHGGFYRQLEGLQVGPTPAGPVVAGESGTTQA
jgi:hypothetical protein